MKGAIYKRGYYYFWDIVILSHMKKLLDWNVGLDTSIHNFNTPYSMGNHKKAQKIFVSCWLTTWHTIWQTRRALLKDITLNVSIKDKGIQSNSAVITKRHLSTENIFKVLFGMPVDSQSQRQLYVVLLRQAVLKSHETNPIPFGILSQGSDPGLHWWWLRSQRLSFYGIPQPSCFPVMADGGVKRSKLLFKTFPNITKIWQEDSRSNSGTQ